jgi:transaldolase
MAEELNLTLKVFADGADVDGIARLASDPLIKGFTTNPTLMRSAGITDYERFAKDVIAVVPTHPLSLEVFSDEFDEMERQALLIAGWGENVYVKVPITNTRGESSLDVVERLTQSGVKVNVTALMTNEQVKRVAERLVGSSGAYVSVFAGRIADTGRDPIPIMRDALATLSDQPRTELIWASPREVLNIFQADAIGCDVITVTHDLLRKLGNVGRDLDDFSLDTVQMFHRDAQSAGYQL